MVTTSNSECPSPLRLRTGPIRPSPPDGLCRQVRRNTRIVVLPEPQHLPASFSELFIDSAIPSHVPIELVLPPFAIVLRNGAVLRTAVPEATVDEDGNLRGAEYDVWSTAHSRQDLSVDTKPQSLAVKCRPDGDLGFRIATSLAAEAFPSVLVKRFDHPVVDFLSPGQPVATRRRRPAPIHPPRNRAASALRHLSTSRVATSPTPDLGRGGSGNRRESPGGVPPRVGSACVGESGGCSVRDQVS